MRGSVTYRSETVSSIAGIAVLDELRGDYLSYDVNVRVNIGDNLQIYADGINLSEEQDEQYYRGDRYGGFFSEIERYGRTFQVGLRATF